MYQTSRGVSTRIIGAIIMTHGDNEGLVLPPRIAPTQLVVIPVAAHKEGVKEKATELYEQVKAAGIRAKIDLSDNTPGWKFAEYEMKGIPLRLEVGPRDIAEGQCVLVRRDTREKTVVKFEDFEKIIPALLEDIQKSLYEKALANREAHTYTAKSLDEMKSILAEHTGFYQVHVVAATSPARRRSKEADRYAEPLHAVRAGAHRRYSGPVCGQKACKTRWLFSIAH